MYNGLYTYCFLLFNHQKIIPSSYLQVQKGYGTKPNNSMKKSVVMSRRAVPLQIVETAI